MARSKLVQKNEKIVEAVVDGYQKIEDSVVGVYKKVEKSVVDGFSRISDHVAAQYLPKEGESGEEAKARLNRKNEERRKAAGAKHPHHGHE